MKLSEWRRSNGRTQEWVAEQLGVRQPFISSVERANNPQIPGPDFMREAYILTRGLVLPNDFYDLPAWQAERIEREGRDALDRQVAA